MYYLTSNKSQMNGYITCFENGGKNMSFEIKNDDKQINEIWNNVKKTLNIKFHSMPLYDEKYMKAKVREFNVKTNALGDEYQKKTCIALA